MGALGPLLGPPGARLGLIWASRGAPFGAFWASVEGSLARSRKQRKSTTVQHFLWFCEGPGLPKSPPKIQNNHSSKKKILLTMIKHLEVGTWPTQIRPDLWAFPPNKECLGGTAWCFLISVFLVFFQPSQSCISFFKKIYF